VDGKRTLTDWGLFAILSLIWAGAYAMTRVAVQTSNPEAGLPVELILPGRLGLGAVILLVVMFAAGHRFPPLTDWRRWSAMVAMGITGMTLPFFLITTAQETVDSSLSALYTAAAPIFVGIGAHILFGDERMTPQKGIGIIVGFLGVFALFGPEAIKNWGSASMVAQLLLIGATAGYATSTLIARGAQETPPLVFSAGFVSVAALCSLPMLFFVEWNTLRPAPSAIAAVIGLGIGPSAIASILYLIVVNRAGATFLSLTGYSIPIVSVVLGFIFFRETQEWNAALAFALILGGVWLSQRPSKAKAETSPQ